MVLILVCVSGTALSFASDSHAAQPAELGWHMGMEITSSTYRTPVEKCRGAGAAL